MKAVTSNGLTMPMCSFQKALSLHILDTKLRITGDEGHGKPRVGYDYKAMIIRTLLPMLKHRW